MTMRWVECSTVAELITGPVKEDIAVVDVRDEVRNSFGMWCGDFLFGAVCSAHLCCFL
jgi:hypothetical protein